MSGRLGRDRFRRDNNSTHHQHHPSSSSTTTTSSSWSSSMTSSAVPRGKNQQPSRHLWVGNLAPHLTEPDLADHFLRFGELESVACNPGRSYGFVNFMREEAAVAALNSLQGSSIAGSGMPLRIEFAKADKSTATARNEDHRQHRDEQLPPNRSSAFPKKESWNHHSDPHASLPDSSKRSDNSSDQPSEILWVGYPSFLKVDDTILRKAFSPFGEIEKITAFPGRTYAFVQFKHLSSACRAKETLQGKLFGNPRVHICFARSDTGSSSSGAGRRGLGPIPPSPRSNHNDYTTRPPHFPNMEYGHPDLMTFNRKESLRSGGNGTYEQRRFHAFGPDASQRQGPQQYQDSTCRDRTGDYEFHKTSPQRFSRKNPFHDDSWDLPGDHNIYHGAKKQKSSPFPQEELPEYPLHNLEHVFPRMVPPDPPVKFDQPLGDKHDWRSSHDTLHSPPPFSSNPPLEWRKSIPELHQPAAKGEWRWEGTIAKGGTPVCRARCFPVGKVMDISLPNFLDCTARTGLDMLAKHYDQASRSWVVFFVPGSDADMGYYNEFMHYLGEKQRAAVSKLDERNTLFLVPPSDFSEKVLKVPGKLSISGVVLRLEPASPSEPGPVTANETNDPVRMHPFIDATSYQSSKKPGISSPSFQGNILNSVPPGFPGYGLPSGTQTENRHEFQPDHRGSTVRTSWPLQLTQPSVSGLGDSATLVGPSQEYRFSRGGVDPSMGNDYRPEYSVVPSNYEQKPTGLSIGGLQQQPPAVLSSTHGGAQVQSSASVAGNFTPAGKGIISNQSQNPLKPSPQYTAPETNRGSISLPASQFLPPQQPMQAEVMQGLSQTDVTGGNQDDANAADPQKRLQATLQLAAALLQQIQQGKGT